LTPRAEDESTFNGFDCCPGGMRIMVEDIREIEVEKLDPNPFQPRVEWQERELRELGTSIKNQGSVSKLY
jgi:hypothetical protein